MLKNRIIQTIDRITKLPEGQIQLACLLSGMAGTGLLFIAAGEATPQVELMTKVLSLAVLWLLEIE